MPTRLIIILFLAGATSLAASNISKIHPSTYTLGQRDDSKVHAWVMFHPKPSDVSSTADVIVNIAAKAKERRRARGILNEYESAALDRPIPQGFLQELLELGVEVRYVSRWLNAASVKIDAGLLPELERLNFVSQIRPVLQMASAPLVEMQPMLPSLSHSKSSFLEYGPSEPQLSLINVPLVHQQGYTGRGITVLMLDTGFYLQHESISPDRIIDQYDFIFNDEQTQNEADDDPAQHRHGTFTLTTLGGYAPGQLIGPAFEARFLLAKTEFVPDEQPVEEDYYVAGLEWGEALGADIVSSSLGYMDWYTPADMDGITAVTTKAVQIATRLGLLVVTAAGNERNNTNWKGLIIAPADVDSIITVGAVDGNGHIASFSSHGPTADGRTKPEVVAQGVKVYAGGSGAPQRYNYAAGTSLATPLVAGSAALLFQAHPDWRPADVRAALMATASQAGAPDNDYGWGIIDVYAALRHNSGQPQSVYYHHITNIYPNPFTVARNTRTTISWSLSERSSVRIDIFNILGKHVANLYARSSKPAGPATIQWRGIDKYGQTVPSGVYTAKLTSDGKVDTRQFILIR